MYRIMSIVQVIFTGSSAVETVETVSNGGFDSANTVASSNLRGRARTRARARKDGLI
jgi:hypothetical protein